MNGSNHFDEEEGKPLYMCPVCKRNYSLCLGIDSVKDTKHLEPYLGRGGRMYDL
jgi:hypothetical protein